jgi:hypothetical protein
MERNNLVSLPRVCKNKKIKEFGNEKEYSNYNDGVSNGIRYDRMRE